MSTPTPEGTRIERRGANPPLSTRHVVISYPHYVALRQKAHEQNTTIKHILEELIDREL